MKTVVIRRLALPGAMAISVLLALAYWWLGNLAHEIFGTAMFALLAWHISVNRLWFRNLLRGRYDLHRALSLALHLLLILNMTVLMVTSVAISKSVFGFLPISGSIYLRGVHWFSAYWVMVIVGIHLGLHWARVMAIIRSNLGLAQGNRLRTSMLRIAAGVAVPFGVWSFSALNVWSKLTFTYSLEFWDFSASVTPFFGYWVAVVALPATVTHYSMTLLRNRRRIAPARQYSRSSAVQTGAVRA